MGKLSFPINFSFQIYPSLNTQFPPISKSVMWTNLWSLYNQSSARLEQAKKTEACDDVIAFLLFIVHDTEILSKMFFANLKLEIMFIRRHREV